MSGNHSTVGTETVYFVQAGADDAPIKIGRTVYPVAGRMAAIQTCCPYPIRLLGTIRGKVRRTERELHRRFAADRIRPDGEWFRASDELLAFIRENAAAGDENAPAKRKTGVTRRDSGMFRAPARRKGSDAPWPSICVHAPEGGAEDVKTLLAEEPEAIRAALILRDLDWWLRAVDAIRANARYPEPAWPLPRGSSAPPRGGVTTTHAAPGSPPPDAGRASPCAPTTRGPG